MSGTTRRLQNQLNELNAEYTQLTDNTTVYAHHLAKKIEETQKALDDSKDMDYDKSMHRCC